MAISLPDDWHGEHLKITDYLLNIDHHDGRAKARVFLRFGFSRDEPDKLAIALLDHVRTVPRRTLESRYGATFIFEGPLVAPNGIMSRLRSVWLMRSGERVGRLVTAILSTSAEASVNVPGT